jgi:hypothetical protein
MYHTVTFPGGLVLDREVSRKQPLDQVRIRAGECLRVQLKPYVVESPDGPMEVADLFFEDGGTARGVPFAFFSFTD